ERGRARPAAATALHRARGGRRERARFRGRRPGRSARRRREPRHLGARPLRARPGPATVPADAVMTEGARDAISALTLVGFAARRTSGSCRVDELLARLSLLLPLFEERFVPRLGGGAGGLQVDVDLVGERLKRVAHAVPGLLGMLARVLPGVAGGLGGLVELGPRLCLALLERVDRLLEPVTGFGAGQVRLHLQLVDLLLELLERLAGLRAVLVLAGHGDSSPLPAAPPTLPRPPPPPPPPSPPPLPP